MPSKRTKLDKIDRKILRDLQHNGRITNVELANRAGISAPPCLRRVRALESNGLIKSYHARVNTSALGFNVIVFAMVKLNSQADATLVEFQNTMEGIPEVRECHLIAGDMDFILKIVARDWDGYQKILTDKLTACPSVVSVKSSLMIRSAFDKPGVPIDE